MTTVAYKNGILAADTLVTAGDTRVDYETKIFKVGRYKFALAGNIFAGYKIRDAILEGREFSGLQLPSLKRENFNCLVADANNLYFLDNELYLQPINKNNCYALGTGDQYALGAMAVGACAKKAVGIACELDIYSGGKINEVRLSWAK